MCSFLAIDVLADTPSRPNIVFILADDMGWSDPGFLGGDIETPNLDRLARDGMFFPYFFNHAKCEPTRASLMTGVHFHRQTKDHVTRDFQNVTTIANVLKDAGYHTACAGKWHLPGQPTDHGFDRFFGLVEGAANHFDPDARLQLDKRCYLHMKLAFDGKPFSVADDNFYSTDAFTDYALQFLGERWSDSPFFLYLAYTAPHWPLQAPASNIQKYGGRYSEGWDRLRAERHQHLIQAGVLPDNFLRADRDPDVVAWETLNNQQQTDAARCMEVHAAMVDRLDEQIGRIISYLEREGELENTLICFASDNGVSAETRFNRTPDKAAGAVDSFRTLPLGFCNAVNTPFQRYKNWNANGGIGSPFIAFWPGHIEGGRVNNKPINILDVMPTLLDASATAYPDDLRPLDRQSILPDLTGQTVNKNEPTNGKSDAMYFQLKFGKGVNQKAVVQWPWKAWFDRTSGWHLYRLDRDWAETVDLKKENPEQLATLIDSYDRFDEEAKKQQERN
ncbi:arylsulfatase [Neorhodopirellula lusitana]|uniref:Arylsulfatase n=1 Tax=Neorhodopirellula lusitana TaxID=445327 RepID=A0ABY1Q413_9BACT|nr:sulfatase-like hydrolase/transferase [Neorhodopirellula lusitana]SMP58751.1 arylsulfatase [Neorhodopirellula lusitana]